MEQLSAWQASLASLVTNRVIFALIRLLTAVRGVERATFLKSKTRPPAALSAAEAARPAQHLETTTSALPALELTDS